MGGCGVRTWSFSLVFSDLSVAFELFGNQSRTKTSIDRPHAARDARRPQPSVRPGETRALLRLLPGGSGPKPINSGPERYFQTTPSPWRSPLPTRLPRHSARLCSTQQLPGSVIRRRVSGRGQPLRPGAPSCPAARQPRPASGARQELGGCQGWGRGMLGQPGGARRELPPARLPTPRADGIRSRSAEGEGQPTAVPAAAPTRGGGGSSFHLATCRAPGQVLGRQGCR